jgi:hypothetical protein
VANIRAWRHGRLHAIASFALVGLEATPMNFESRWTIGDRVHIDDCSSITATVTAFCFRATRAPTVEVSYFHNGEAKTAWPEEGRLSRVTELEHGG